MTAYSEALRQLADWLEENRDITDGHAIYTETDSKGEPSVINIFSHTTLEAGNIAFQVGAEWNDRGTDASRENFLGFQEVVVFA